MTGLYKVQRITGKRKNQKGAIQYKVKWQGYPDSQSTWEPLRNLRNVQEMVDQFEKRNAHKMAQGLRNKQPLRISKEKPTENRDDKSEKSERSDREVKYDREIRSEKPIVKAEKELKDNREMDRSLKRRETRFVSKSKNQKRREPAQVENNEILEQEIPEQRLIQDEQSAESKRKQFPPDIEEQTEYADVQVLQIEQDKKGAFLFLVQDNQGRQIVKSHDQMKENHSMALILFYESKLRFA